MMDLLSILANGHGEVIEAAQPSASGGHVCIRNLAAPGEIPSASAAAGKGNSSKTTRLTSLRSKGFKTANAAATSSFIDES
ncbi:hypothetical protein J2Y41_004640 [Arthrobacter sp. 1088]|nr:hypothetical protein [Arthrobacter sp. 1088]